MAESLRYKDYVPLYVNGKRDKARRYVSASDAKDIIGVRAFQEGAHREASSPRQALAVSAEKAGRRDVEQLSRYANVAGRVRRGESLSSALRQEHMSKALFERLNEQQENYVGRSYDSKGKSYRRATGDYRAGWNIPGFDSQGNAISTILDVDRPTSSLLGKYYAAIGLALDNDDPSYLKKFEGITIRDLDGNTYALITDLNTLALWLQAMGFDGTNFYEIIYLKGAVLAA